MAAKLAVTADWQFDLYPEISTPDADYTTSRLRQLLECLDWAYGVARKKQCEAMLVLGDVFNNRRTVDIPVLNAVCSAFSAQAKTMPTFIISGNHDSYGRDARCTSVVALAGEDVQVITEPRIVEFSSSVRVGFVPWRGDEAGLLEDIRTVTRSKVQLLCGHVLLQEVSPSGIGTSSSVFLGADCPVLLGDVHEMRDVRQGVHYVGAPCQHHFGDAGGDRGMGIITLSKGHKYVFEREVNTLSPRFVTVQTREDIAEAKGAGYVRVRSDDPEVAAEAVERLGGDAWYMDGAGAVYSSNASPPRLEISAESGDEGMIRAYVEHMATGETKEEREALIKTGLRIQGGAQ